VENALNIVGGFGRIAGLQLNIKKSQGDLAREMG